MLMAPFTPQKTGPNFVVQSLGLGVLLLLLALLLGATPASAQQDSVRVPVPSDRDCSDFASELGAQSWYSAVQYIYQFVDGSQDPHRLDGDGDGQACEGISVLKREATSDSTYYTLTGEIQAAVCPDTTVETGEYLSQIRSGIRSGSYPDGFRKATRCIGLQSQIDTDSLLSGVEGPPGGPRRYGSLQDTCQTNVDNATVHVPPTAGGALPNGDPIAQGDTLFVMSYTTGEELICSGQGAWVPGGGATLAAAGSDRWTNGYVAGEPIKLFVLDGSTGLEFRVEPEWAPPGPDDLNDYWQEGVYQKGTFNKVSVLDAP